MRKKKYVFDEEKGIYNAKSSRYQTRRLQEKQESLYKDKQDLLEIGRKLNEPELYLDEELEVLQKKYKTLIKKFKVNKKKNNDLLIPFYLNPETVVYIREQNCFKPKWLKIFGNNNMKRGKEYVKKRIDEYKKIKIFNITNDIYWNPF